MVDWFRFTTSHSFHMVFPTCSTWLCSTWLCSTCSTWLCSTCSTWLCSTWLCSPLVQLGCVQLGVFPASFCCCYCLLYSNCRQTSWAKQKTLLTLVFPLNCLLNLSLLLLKVLTGFIVCVIAYTRFIYLCSFCCVNN